MNTKLITSKDQTQVIHPCPSLAHVCLLLLLHSVLCLSRYFSAYVFGSFPPLVIFVTVYALAIAVLSVAVQSTVVVLIVAVLSVAVECVLNQLIATWTLGGDVMVPVHL